jgi:uncharacterized protein (DUF2147 family)
MTMRRASLTFAVLTVLAVPAHADPTGEWLVEDGRAHIRIAICAERLWGAVSWEHRPGGFDSNNPDPALRNRPTLGLPIVLGMKPVEPNRWEGSLYNPENGKTYQGNIRLKRSDLLEVEGCVLSGWICSGQDWTRVVPPPSATPPTPPTARGAPPPASVGRAPTVGRPAQPGAGAAPPTDLCVKLGIATGRPPEGASKSTGRAPEAPQK